VDWFLVCPIYRERYKTLSVAEKICENLSPRGITELKLKTAPRVRCQIYIALNHRAIGFSRGTRANGEAGFTSRIYYRSAINCQRGRAGRRPSWFRSARITRLESPPRFRKRAATKWWRRGISQTRYFSLRWRASMRERERQRERERERERLRDTCAHGYCTAKITARTPARFYYEWSVWFNIVTHAPLDPRVLSTSRRFQRPI